MVSKLIAYSIVVIKAIKEDPESFPVIRGTKHTASFRGNFLQEPHCLKRVKTSSEGMKDQL